WLVGPKCTAADQVRRLGEDGLTVDKDTDLVGHEHAARLEGLVPGQTEVLPVDLRGSGEAQLLLAPRVLSASRLLGLEDDRACHTADRQLAGDAVLRVAEALETGGGEADLGVTRHVEEVGRAQVLVAL